MSMQLPVLRIPLTLSFKNIQQSKIIKLENPYDHPIAYKIKTNKQKSIQIPISHGFLMGKSTRQIPVVLTELISGIKLQLSYAWATNEMVRQGNSKLNTVQKSKIKKSVIEIQMTNRTNSQPKQSKQHEISPMKSNQYKVKQKTQFLIQNEGKIQSSHNQQKKQQKIQQSKPKQSEAHSQKKKQIKPKQAQIHSQRKKQSNSKVDRYVNRLKPQLTLTNVTSQRQLNANIIKLIEQPDQQDKQQIIQQIRKFNEQLQVKKKQYTEKKQNTPIKNDVIILSLLISFLIGVIVKSIMTYFLLNNNEITQEN